MAQTYSDAGLLPSATLQPYGQNILKYGIGQLGTPIDVSKFCLLYTSPSPRDRQKSRMPSSA